jgi:hypothetical protein
MLVGLLGLLTALVNAHMPVGPAAAAAGGAHRRLDGAARRAHDGRAVHAVPALAPLWGIPNDAMTGRSGLSAQMQVGNVAQLALDDSIAMRVRFEGPPPPQSHLYFRGPVLSTSTAASGARCCRARRRASRRRAAAGAAGRPGPPCATRSRWSRTTGPGC